MFLHLTIGKNVSVLSTEGIGLLTTLEPICLDLLKGTGWQTKPLELVGKEQQHY